MEPLCKSLVEPFNVHLNNCWGIWIVSLIEDWTHHHNSQETIMRSQSLVAQEYHPHNRIKKQVLRYKKVQCDSDGAQQKKTYAPTTEVQIDMSNHHMKKNKLLKSNCTYLAHTDRQDMPLSVVFLLRRHLQLVAAPLDPLLHQGLNPASLLLPSIDGMFVEVINDFTKIQKAGDLHRPKSSSVAGELGSLNIGRHQMTKSPLVRGKSHIQSNVLVENGRHFRSPRIDSWS